MTISRTFQLFVRTFTMYTFGQQCTIYKCRNCVKWFLKNTSFLFSVWKLTKKQNKGVQLFRIKFNYFSLIKPTLDKVWTWRGREKSSSTLPDPDVRWHWTLSSIMSALANAAGTGAAIWKSSQSFVHKYAIWLAFCIFQMRTPL